MPAYELTNTQALIDRYYTEEKEKKAQALTRAELNLQLDANDLAMLSTIAKRFGKSRDDLAKDVLSHALIDLLTQIEPGERKLIARDADEMGISMAREIAEENGVKEIDHKTNVWTGHDRAIAKAEKKRAKELEEAQKQAAKADKMNTSTQATNDDSAINDSAADTANAESTPILTAEASVDSPDDSADNSADNSAEAPTEASTNETANEPQNSAFA